MMRLPILFLATILISSCSTERDDQSLKPEIIEVLRDNHNTENADSFIEDIKFIDLKTEESFFGEISKMRIFKDKIYILDEQVRAGLYVYNLSGDLIYEYRNKGQAPNQYLQLTDFLVNEDESVELLDSYLQKIFIIDNNGRHLETKKMSFPASDFSKYENHYFFHTNNLEVSNGEEPIGLLVKSDLDLTERENIVPLDTARGEFILNQRGENFFEWNDNAYFMDIFSNTAISLNPSEPDLVFDFGNKSFPDNFFGQNDYPEQGLYLNHIFSNELAWNLTGFYGFDHLLFFKFALGMNEMFTFYDESNSSVAMNSKRSWESTNPCFSFFSLPVATYEDKLVFALNANQVSQLKSKGCSEVEDLEVDENNILMLMKIK